MARSVRWQAGFLVVFGAIAAACGFAAGLLPLALIGVVLAAAGLWNFWRPSVTGLIVDGVTMILTGASIALAWLWMPEARESSAGKWILAGGLQIAWGIRRLALFAAARHAYNDPDAIARLSTIVRDLSRRKAKDDPSIAEFRTGRFRTRNRLGLYAEGVIGLLEHQAVRLEKRTDIWIETQGSTSLGRSIKVRVQMSDLQLTGVMPTAHFERFERWKLGQSQPRSIAA